MANVWDDRMIADLRTWWDEGFSTPEIGRRLGVSKNAVVGKAHRLDLEARPSPIIRNGEPRRPYAVRVPRAKRPSLPPLASAQPPLPPLASVKPPPQPSKPIIVAPPAPPPSQRIIVAKRIPCCWPLGDPGTRSFRFCEDPSKPGKPYCEPHARIAYVKVRDLRDNQEIANG